MYNQIKAAEARKDADRDALASWKAGFIEDADELHLAPKPMFATLIKNWAADAAVKAAFVSYAPGGQPGLDGILADVKATPTQVASAPADTTRSVAQDAPTKKS